METHRQTCQKCGSRLATNIIARAPGSSDKVYVKCANCSDLIARYTIAPRGYYHHGKGFESYLRGINRGGHYDSSEEIICAFEAERKNCLEEFERLSEIVEAKTRAEKNARRENVDESQ